MQFGGLPKPTAMLNFVRSIFVSKVLLLVHYLYNWQVWWRYLKLWPSYYDL